MKIAYQGIPGSYSEAAIIKKWGDNYETLPCEYLEDVFNSIINKKADFGVVPAENSIEGTISRTYDLLNEFDLKIQGETIFRVVHCLIALKGVNLTDIKKVYSHPQALGQTREFILKNNYVPVNYFDTAGSVKLLKDEGIRNAAAVASRRAAEIYGLEVLIEGIETNQQNFTRFLHIGYQEPDVTGHDKTSLAFTLAHKPGTLLNALRSLARRKINLTKIESRPLIGKPWEYIFFIDIEGHKEDSIVKEALFELEKSTFSMKILGSYPVE
ncbi:prephenate dehydratase [Candidatus Bathyarchaeota archaeon]|nr:prephenate dehydratase [Candidatus Bathyarchaeota archaeon]